MFNNPISALIIGTAMIATALILKPCLEGRKCQYDNTKQYRYQFIDNQYYWKEKVFDRETGVVYSFGKNEDGMAYRQDFTKGRLDGKKRKEGYWMSPDDKYDIYGNEDYLLYVANKTTAGNNKEEPVFFGADEEEDTSQGSTVPKKAKSPTTFDASTFRFDDEEFGEIEPINTNGMHNKKVEDLPCIEEENAKLLKQKDRQ